MIFQLQYNHWLTNTQTHTHNRHMQTDRSNENGIDNLFCFSRARAPTTNHPNRERIRQTEKREERTNCRTDQTHMGNQFLYIEGLLYFLIECNYVSSVKRIVMKLMVRCTNKSQNVFYRSFVQISVMLQMIVSIHSLCIFNVPEVVEANHLTPPSLPFHFDLSVQFALHCSCFYLYSPICMDINSLFIIGSQCNFNKFAFGRANTCMRPRKQISARI